VTNLIVRKTPSEGIEIQRNQILSELTLPCVLMRKLYAPLSSHAYIAKVSLQKRSMKLNILYRITNRELFRWKSMVLFSACLKLLETFNTKPRIPS